MLGKHDRTPVPESASSRDSAESSDADLVAAARRSPQAFEHLERFDPERGSVAGWLFTIARCRIADDQRRLGRLRRAFRRQRPEPIADDDLLTGVICSEEAAQLRRAMTRVPKNDREVLLLRYVAGLSGPEIGAMLNLSAGAVRVRLHRALRRLSNELGAPDADG